MREGNRTLSHEDARAVYDRTGRRQDCHRFYEDPATRTAIRLADLEGATAVFEFGCGTGRFAALLLERHLMPGAHYTGVDSSGTMVSLATRRLARFGGRVQVRLTDGAPRFDVASASVDRFFSNYVLDLLSDADIRAVLDEAHRMLAPRGILAVVGLTHGRTRMSRMVARSVQTIHALRPSLVGGCRPVNVLEFVGQPEWQVRHHETVMAFTVPSQVLVAEKNH